MEMMDANSKFSVQSEIGFADSTVERIVKQDDQVIVLVKAWNEQALEAAFTGVIGLRESMAYDLSDLIVCDCVGALAEWSRSRAYSGDTAGNEKLYQFLDVEGHPALEIVAAGVAIRKVT